MTELEALVRALPPFAKASDELISDVLSTVKEQKLSAGELLFSEGDPGDALYVVVEGRLRCWCNSASGPLDVGTITAGQICGEMAFLDDAPRSASVGAMEPTTILRFHGQSLRENMRRHSGPVANLYLELARQLSGRMRNSDSRMIEALRLELQKSRDLADLGRVITFFVGLMLVYGMALHFMTQLIPAGMPSTVVSGPLIVVLGLGIAYIARKSKRGWAFYGLSTEGWRGHILDMMKTTGPFLAILVLFKYWLIHHVPELEGTSLFIEPARITPHLCGLFVFYCLLTPVQEFVVRAVFQSSLAEFLTGRRAGFWAVLLSNGMFSFSHLHISPTFALLVFVPGLYWGWLYSRQRTLVGAGVSHLIIGAVALFLLELGVIFKQLG